MQKAIMWFRSDLRLCDNPALFEAAHKYEIIPIYIDDQKNANEHRAGAASNVWLHHSLKKLNQSLNQNLLIVQGDPKDILDSLIEKYDIAAVYWNRNYEPWRMKRDQKIKFDLTERGLDVRSFNGGLLLEPWENLKEDGSAYRVFTPYYKKLLEKMVPLPYGVPSAIHYVSDVDAILDIDALNLMPEKLDWHIGMMQNWSVGERAAYAKLENFCAEKLQDYKKNRDFPSIAQTSTLAPHLHFGEISPKQVWRHMNGKYMDGKAEAFLRQLVWREFSYNQLYYNQDMDVRNLNQNFDHFPWQKNDEALQKWQRGQTGFPIIDAGMRELWQTGNMHNRVRMIVASFLVKNLNIHWHQGYEWFWDCLLDADLANNSASWQWVAGCGLDAAPYFRIFNPITQSKKFDPDGEYIKRYVPELKTLPTKYLFEPHLAPKGELLMAGIEIGKDYPAPMVDLKSSREAAMANYQWMKAAAQS